MTDEVNYAIPYGPFGGLANGMLAQGQLKRIFDYRASTLEKMFTQRLKKTDVTTAITIFFCSLIVGAFLFRKFVACCTHCCAIHEFFRSSRLPWRPSGKSRYLQRMIHAHYTHHARHTRNGCEAFGFLLVLRKYEPKNFHQVESRQDTP
ncbi:MAG TPA: hypothetical protein VK658_17395 [Chryseolinea sp.]|nr:hypothetical protein [Chryseolinea sp.]